MPYTTNKGFSVQATGSNAGTWGADSSTPTANASNALNEGAIQLIDQALGGVTSLSLTNVNVALTQLQTQNGMLRLSGTLTGNVVISPDVGVLMTGFYCFENVTTGNFTVTITNSGGSVVLPQTRRGVFWINTADGPRIIAIAGSTAADPIPVGTVMVFYQSAAPTGWTISSALNDYALKIVSSAGGVTSGSVSYATLFGRTATDSHALTESEIPSHSHTNPLSLFGSSFSGGGATFTNANGALVASNQTTGLTGGGGGHTHGIDMRVRTASVILAAKN